MVGAQERTFLDALVVECVNAIYLVLYLTHTHTHVGLFKFIIAIYKYVLLTQDHSFNPLSTENISKVLK